MDDQSIFIMIAVSCILNLICIWMGFSYGKIYGYYLLTDFLKKHGTDEAKYFYDGLMKEVSSIRQKSR